MTAMISVARAEEDPNALKCRMVIANTDRATQQVTALISKLEDSLSKQQAVLRRMRDHQQQEALQLQWSVAEMKDVLADANQQKASIAKLREYCDGVLKTTEAKQ